MEKLEMIFGYFLMWLMGAVSVALAWFGGSVIRFHFPINDPFVIWGGIILEIFVLAVVLLFVFSQGYLL